MASRREAILSRYAIPQAELAELEARVDELEPRPGKKRDTHIFAGLFGYEGLMRRRWGAGRQRPMHDREFMESMLYIRPKAGKIIPFTLNAEQRKFEAAVLKMERAGVPVRIVILKPRQVGFSTYIEARIFTRILRSKFLRGRVVAHKDSTAKLLLKMSKIMSAQMPRGKNRYGDVSRWRLEMPNAGARELSFGEPINGAMEIASADSEDPGHGDTCQVLQLSELALWPNAEEGAKGLMQILPDDPGTLAFAESTAKGDFGYFRDLFMAAWEERHLPFDERKTGWHPLFIAWFEHEEYRWSQTYGRGKKPSAEHVARIRETLTREEKDLLGMTYFRRGYGPCQVGYDQLAWRRRTIATKANGDLVRFMEQYPSTVEEAFIASGSPTFNIQRIDELLRDAPQPEWVGEIISPESDRERVGEIQDSVFVPRPAESMAAQVRYADGGEADE